MTDGIDRRKTKDVLWMTFQCALEWKHSLLRSYATDDSAIESLEEDVKAIEKLRGELFSDTQDRLKKMIREAELVDILELRELMEGKGDQPCGHPGCFSHVTHPCEGRGRIAGGVSSAETEDDHGLD